MHRRDRLHMRVAVLAPVHPRRVPPWQTDPIVQMGGHASFGQEQVWPLPSLERTETAPILELEAILIGEPLLEDGVVGRPICS